MKQKLWQKDIEPDKKIIDFTVGSDYLLDQKLLKFDCLASIAHAKMLKKIGILSDDELTQLEQGLKEIIQSGLDIKPEQEDCHTAIEQYLTQKFGDVGKKIHTARSRNDQVLTALRLYEKHELKQIMDLVGEFKQALEQKITQQGHTKLPGYTHMQKAMPTDIKTWLGSFIAASDDDLLLLESILHLIDQSPLGSAAGFDVPIDIDQDFTAKELGFSSVMNPIYAQMSRGKFESLILHAISQIMFLLNKLATDLTLFSMKEFSYVNLSPEICTGSSIMPQKKNPDILELVRAKYHIILGEQFKVQSLIGNLMSGYNRDVQLTKEPLIASIETMKECLEVMTIVIQSITIDEDKCKQAMTPELFATEEAYKLVKQGMPFREAYQEIGKKFK
ncbi:argininosuccinate lyase [Nanoarchaeota archaeon]